MGQYISSYPYEEVKRKMFEYIDSHPEMLPNIGDWRETLLCIQLDGKTMSFNDFKYFTSGWRGKSLLYNYRKYMSYKSILLRTESSEEQNIDKDKDV